MKNPKAKQNKKKEVVSVPKPELLLPAGNPEAFMAALSGGADAVYLGIDQFNARGRAKNFHLEDIPSLHHAAKEHGAKLYLTLNTLIKNRELKELIRILLAVEKLPVSALIIQDLGVLYLLKKHFPRLEIHSSTQMGNHNSLDCQFAEQQGFARVILARELSLKDIIHITERSKANLEIFVHGALCYSYSGYCLMSSWLGGNSANRGLCRQPCRQFYQDEDSDYAKRMFCMKDYQLIDYLPQICAAGVKAIKIEGRMRSAEYVYQVAKAYRMALDDFINIPKAKLLLSEDGGRDKTSWRFESGEESVFSNRAQTGILVGNVTEIDPGSITIELVSAINTKQNLMVYTTGSLEALTIKTDNFYNIKSKHPVQAAAAGETIVIRIDEPTIDIGSAVYRLPHAMSNIKNWQPKPIANIKPDLKRLETIYKQLRSKASLHKTPDQIYLRIKDPNWLPLIDPSSIKAIICPMGLGNSSFAHSSEIWKTPTHKLIPETPLYIDESDVFKIKSFVQQMQKMGMVDFSISRLSHLSLFDRQMNSHLIANEYIYTMNDAAIALLSGYAIRDWILPLENDYPNILSSTNRQGIIPLYFHPPLYLSKQEPVDFANAQYGKQKELKLGIGRIQTGQAKDGKQATAHQAESFYLEKEHKLTKLSSRQAVCLFNFYPRLSGLGYHKYLIDLCAETPNPDTLARILDFYAQAKNLPGSNSFNFKKGLH